MLKGEARRRGMSIQVVDHQPDCKVLGDPVRLQQVLVNLVLNALESMVGQPNSDKTVAIDFEESPKKIVVTVSDSGCGGRRLATGKDSSTHSLRPSHPASEWDWLLVEASVEEHGGTLRYDAREGGGSKFIIELPNAMSS